MQPACVLLFHSLHVTGPRRGPAPSVHLHSTRSPCACSWPTDVGGSHAACALSYWQLLHRSCSEAVRRLHTRTLGMMTSSEAVSPAPPACMFFLSFLQYLAFRCPYAGPPLRIIVTSSPQSTLTCSPAGGLQDLGAGPHVGPGPGRMVHCGQPLHQPRGRCQKEGRVGEHYQMHPMCCGSAFVPLACHEIVLQLMRCCCCHERS